MSSNEGTATKEEKIKEFVRNNSGIIRDCYEYEKEYKECKCLQGRFQQYFVFGEFLDCKPLKSKWKNCEKCEKLDFEACAYVIREENKLKHERLRLHMQNDVWKRRTKPPSDWNKELPDWAKTKEIDSFLVEERSRCVVS